MIPRYAKEVINKIFSDENKTNGWQKVEFAVLRGWGYIGKIIPAVAIKIIEKLEKIPIDLIWWRHRDKEVLHHDLNAFVEERQRHLSPEQAKQFHKRITSYDDEEAPFAGMLNDATNTISSACQELLATIKKLALTYRFTIMNGRTHGQEAEMQSFGKRCLTWYRELQDAYGFMLNARENLKYSKLSGAIGNYGGSLDPKIEKFALDLLGLKPYYGSTQIMPRSLYVPLACSLAILAAVIQKIALDIRLGARSGRPIYQEPFEKLQTGSSAMPHKKNTILTEQIEGMFRMAKGYLTALMDNAITWEERAIEQSCVERVVWPDLFHVTLHMFETISKVLTGLVVYPDNMMQEIIESRGCYASGEAKEFLKEKTEKYDLPAEEAYRIMQLAAFNIFEISPDRLIFRGLANSSLAEADVQLSGFRRMFAAEREKEILSIEYLVPRGELVVSRQLDIKPEQVNKWNALLKEILSDPKSQEEWHEIFKPSFLLKNEEILYQKILGIK
jgi:adenylosuccinate lyase